MIDYIPIAILTIILFIFLINRQRKKAQKKRIAAEKQRIKAEEQKKREKEEYDKEYNSLKSIEKNVKCDDGITRRYGGFMFGIIKEEKEIPFEQLIISDLESTVVGKLQEYISTEKWFSEEGITLNSAQILSRQVDYHRLEYEWEKIEKRVVQIRISYSDLEFEKRQAWSGGVKVILINNIFFEAGGRYSRPIPLKLFSGTINDIIISDGASTEFVFEKSVQCDDGVTRTYKLPFNGIIKEKGESEAIGEPGNFHFIEDQKWFSEEGTTLNAAEIIKEVEDIPRSENIYTQIIDVNRISRVSLTGLISVNNIILYDKKYLNYFSGTIDGKKYEDGVIVQPKNKETDTSDKIDFDEFEGFVPFEEVIDNMKEILGTEVFEIFGLVGYTNSESGYIASDKNNTTSDEETLLKAFFEKYKVLYACFSLVAKEEKMDISSVMDLIYPDLKKTPSWVSNASEVSQSTIHMLFYSSRTNDLNNKAFEDFEKKDYNKGLAKAAESLFLLFLHPSKIFAFKSDMAIYLDTLGWGLFLNQQFLHSATVHTKSIALDSDSDNIAIHLFNRGMALYSMVSPTEIGIDLDDKQLDFKQRNIDLAKADFQKALEKNSSFEQAQEMLESLNR